MDPLNPSENWISTFSVIFHSNPPTTDILRDSRLVGYPALYATQVGRREANIATTTVARVATSHSAQVAAVAVNRAP